MNCPRCGHPHSQAEWDELFTDWRIFFQRRRGYDARKSFMLAHREMAKHGPRPDGPPKPPLWLRMGAKLAGEGDTLMGIWKWLNGKKTLIGAILVAAPVVWEGIQPVLAAGGASPEFIAAVAGGLLGFVGIAHKVLKAVGLAEKPEE